MRLGPARIAGGGIASLLAELLQQIAGLRSWTLVLVKNLPDPLPKGTGDAHAVEEREFKDESAKRDGSECSISLVGGADF
jgi:hypothetical protein